MIHIISDFNKLVKDSNEFVVSKIGDYIPSYAEILNRFENKQDIIIYVQLRPVMYWFEQMAERYPEGTFTFENIDARTRLQQLWNIEIPASVSPQEIVQSDLLDLELFPDAGDRFEDYILEIFYDPIYKAREFPFNNLVCLIDAFDEQKWKRNERLPLIYRTYLNRLEQWKTNAKNQEQKRLISLIDSEPCSIKIELMKYKALQFYKDLGYKLLGKEYSFYNQLKCNLHDLPINENEIPEVITQITYILNDIDNPTSRDEVIVLINSVSGYLMIEYEEIERLLSESSQLISEEIIQALKQKFISLENRIGKRIAKLADLIQPEIPAFPSKDYDIDSMLAWATESYLPYQAWCDKNNKVDPKIYEMADVFATWFMDNWHEIHANSKRMVFNILSNHAKQLNQNGSKNLILVIDNLAWMYVPKVKDLFQENGYFLTSMEPYLSMVPSETEISKKCLLSGSPTYSEIDDKSYSSIIEKGWVPYFNQADFQYLSDIGKLKNLKNLDAQVYVVNYLAIDIALHASSNQLGLPHAQQVPNILKDFVDTVIEFIKKHDLKDKIKIHIVSDHGSIRIPKDVFNGLNFENFKNSDFQNVSHRYVEVSNNLYGKLSDNLKVDCFFIPSNEFGNPNHFLCARKANRFLYTDNTFYVHSGLSPEEMVVPHLVFEAALTPVKELTILITNNQFRYRIETVELEIGNPNQYPVEDINISTLNSNFDMEQQRIEWLNRNKNIKIMLKGLFKQSRNQEERKTLSFLINYSCHGEQYSQTEKLPIEMKSMVELKDTSMFEDLD